MSVATRRAAVSPGVRMGILAVFALFAVLGLAWRSLGDTSLGTLRYFHLPMVLVLLLATGRLPLLKRVETLTIVCVLYTLAYVVSSWYHGVPPYAAQQGIYFGGAFMVAALLRQATYREWRLLRWAGPVASALFVITFWADAGAAGVEPIAVARAAVTTGNLDLIPFSLFQPIFTATGTEGVVNGAALRGQALAGILVPMYLSVYACTIVRRKGALFAGAYWSSIAIVLIFVALSLARSLQLAAAAAILLPLVRIGLRTRARPATMLAVGGGATLCVLALTTPVVGLIWERLTSDTGSYIERGNALRLAIDSIARSPLVGSKTGGDALALATGDRSTLSAHNFILDAAVIGGVVTGVLAAIIVVIVLRDLVRAFGRYLSDASLFAPLGAAILTPVQMFTGGSGTLTMSSLMGLAVFYAVITSEPTANGEVKAPAEQAHGGSDEERPEELRVPELALRRGGPR